MYIRNTIIISGITLMSGLSFIHCLLEIIPERADVEYFNPRYLKHASFRVRKTGRGGIYVANLAFTSYVTMGNNASVHLIFYQYLHNEYRRSFVEMHFKLCDMINNDPFAGTALRNAGFVCPVTPNTYRFDNLTLAVPEIEKMKWVFPFERCKVQGVIEYPAVNTTIAIGYLALTIRQVQRKTKN